jgi:hypothetical protein
MPFNVTTANAISMGGAPRPFPAVLSVSIKADLDGSPGGEAAAVAAQPNVQKGATELDFVLGQP